MIISVVDLQHNPRGRRARMAREHFAANGPPDAQPLPLGYAERERMKIGGLSTIVALYARSLACEGYNLEKHPSFQDYACGIMASSSLVAITECKRTRD
jgi:hypothetical protein